jgi:hypothetical protein
MGTLDETTLTDPLLPVSDMDVTFIEKASIQSAGESPMLTWTTVVAAGVGDGLDPVPEEPLLHALSAMLITRTRMTAAVLNNLRC